MERCFLGEEGNSVFGYSGIQPGIKLLIVSHTRINCLEMKLLLFQQCRNNK